MAAVFAAANHDVVGVDKNHDLVQAMREGRALGDGPDLQETIDAGRSRLRATPDVAQAVAVADLTFVVVPTPSGPDGTDTNEFVVEVVSEFGASLRRKLDYHVVVVTSTVMPGSAGGPIADALEQSSGRRVGESVGLVYDPEVVALGSVIRDMRFPDFLLIGERDPRAGEIVVRAHEAACPKRSAARRMSFVNAELAKISLNTFVTTKISYANMIAEICEKLPGADAAVVSDAVGCDSRVGRKYLTGATGYGGPCFPRDNVALTALADGLGAAAWQAEATDRVTDYQVDRLAALVSGYVAPGGTVAVLGLAYKPLTAVIEESQGVALAARLAAAGHSVRAHDPQAGPAARKVLGAVEICATAAAAVAGAALAIIMTAWPEYGALDVEAFGISRPVIVDCWRVLQKLPIDRALIVRIGEGPTTETVLVHSRNAIATGDRTE